MTNPLPMNLSLFSKDTASLAYCVGLGVLMIFLEKPEPESSENYNMDSKVQALECLLCRMLWASNLVLGSGWDFRDTNSSERRHPRKAPASFTYPFQASWQEYRCWRASSLRHPWHSSRTPDPGINHPPTFRVIIRQGPAYPVLSLHLAPAQIVKTPST